AAPRRLVQRRVRSLRRAEGSGQAAAVAVNFLGVLFDGIAYGSLLFLISVGLSITLGLMKVVNLAHGAFAMFGGYCSVWLTGAWGLPFLWTLPLVCLAGAGV